MKLMVINGSPRKTGNTHTLLTNVIEGAADAQSELVNLYDLDFKGCIGCLVCKVKNGKSLGKCPINDDLKPILEKIDSCDGLVLGSPIYLGNVTAMMRAFLERLIFQYLSYDDHTQSYFNGNIKTAFVYTMNIPEEALPQSGYMELFKSYEVMMGRHFTYAETLLSTETLQVADYSKYHMAQFDEEERRKRHEDVFPDDCRRAYDLGRNLLDV